MRKVIFAMTLAAHLLTLAAADQVGDAFQGILPVTDPSAMTSLNGQWQLKVVDGISDNDGVPVADDTWGTIAVPGCWEAYGFARPSYDSARPLTGYYRTTFTVPAAWKGQRIVLRFDGVLYGYDLWVNGHKAGSWRSAYNTALFDITDHLGRSGESQELAMRVITQFPGSDFDCNDDWAPCGIFRDVTLMAVPDTHLSDLTITTRNTGEVSVKTLLEGKGEVVHEIIDAQGRIVATMGANQAAKVDKPHLWTAETPYLYTLRTTLTRKGRRLQVFNHKFGFRDLTIDGNVLKLNGQPVKLRGVTCHSTDPRTVKVVDDDLTLKDMRMMKQASVNYIRTSHYPREPRFYELADSLGFYVISEVPFGYGDKNLSKPEFYPVLQQRAQATIRRDKNHASILIWSLGNENPLTDICIRLGQYVASKLDDTRPYCYPQVGSYFRRFFEGDKAKGFPSEAPLYTPHYPTTGQIAGFYQHLDRPVVFTEYCHSLGTSLEDHDRQWNIIERTPGIAGGSVWEWVDQGMPFGMYASGNADSEKMGGAGKGGKATPGSGQYGNKYGYEEKVFTSPTSGFEMFDNKGTDGLLYADRTPLPNYFELQHNYARAFVSSLDAREGLVELGIVNRFDFINLKDQVAFSWTLTQDRDTLCRGSFSPSCAPHDSVGYTLCLPVVPDTTRRCLLNVAISDAQGNTFLVQSLPIGRCNTAARLLAGLPATKANPMDMVQEAPMVRAGRKATMAEKLKVGDKRLERYLLRIRDDGTTAGPVAARVDTQADGNATRLEFTLDCDTTDTFLSELGVALLLDKRIDRVQWIGQGPMPTYPGRYQANRPGLWAMQQGDLYFEGNRRGVDAALLTDAEGNGLLLVCQQGDVSFEQTDRGIVVSYNVAVAGQGPKFARTAFPVVARDVGTTSGHFHLYAVEAGQVPAIVGSLFGCPADVRPPFRPFLTQYDTYLMRFGDIVQ